MYKIDSLMGTFVKFVKNTLSNPSFCNCLRWALPLLCQTSPELAALVPVLTIGVLLTGQFAFISRILSSMTPSLSTASRTAGHASQAPWVILRTVCCFCLRLEDNTSLAFLPQGIDYLPSSLQINTLNLQQSWWSLSEFSLPALPVAFIP